MIEADIVLGTLNTSESSVPIPIMAHPPNNISDLSLESFLSQILNYNTNNHSKQKGIKLDFKSIEVFEASQPIINSLWIKITSSKCPIWLNADIIAGPVNATTTPVDHKRFLNISRTLTSSTLSIGWTTNWGPKYEIGEYNNKEIQEMVAAINGSDIKHDSHNITFPVRAGIAANSLTQLDSLYSTIKKTHNVTFTIWSGVDDNVNVKKLRNFILHFGVDKVYVDVPDSLYKQLHLPSSASSLSGMFTRYFSIALVIMATLYGISNYI